MKPIEGFDGYFVSEEGNIYSNKSGKLKEMKQWLNNKGYTFVLFMKKKPNQMI